MIRLLALAPVLASLAACSKALPRPVHYRTTLAKAVQSCQSGRTEYSCSDAGTWLELQGRDDEALALYRRGCASGDLLSCWGVLEQTDDLEARWTLCSNPVYSSWPQCRTWLATAPLTDGRRRELVERRCASADTCSSALATLVALDEPTRQWAAQLCETARPDEATCAAIVQLDYPDPGLGVALRRSIELDGCAAGLGALCVAAAEPGLLADTSAEVGAAREQIRRGCQLGAAAACARERQLVDRDAWFSSCKRGDRAGCQELGADTARRRAEAGLEPVSRVRRTP